MKCIITCAGYATRLGELGQNTPKSLIKIKGKFLLDYIMEGVLDLDIDEIFIISNNRFYSQFEEWYKNYSSSIKITLINDGTNSKEERLGTLRDIKLALDTYNDDSLIIFGDSYYNFDLKKSYDFFQKKEGPVLVLSDIGLERAKTSTIISSDNEDRIIYLEPYPKDPKFSTSSAGIYYLKKENKKDIDKYLQEGKNPDGITWFFGDIMKNKKVFSYLYDKENNFYIDIGHPETIILANSIEVKN